ncbi:MAG: septum formation protein Maf [Lachnospiraceae bacterium]|nr:septum formation protein Maf [Lachnospiraceae bacterium]
MIKLILASGSPRRRELLSKIGYTFEVIPSDAPEIVTESQPAKVVEALSRLKARDIYERSKVTALEDFVVLGADTIVAFEDQIMGKPVDKAHAYEMLKSLQGREHSVYTGVTLCGWIDGRNVEDTFHVRTIVKFFNLTDAEIEEYLSHSEYEDKAGSYAIQGLGTLLVEKIDGDFNNVVGLPVASVHRHLSAMCGNR